MNKDTLKSIGAVLAGFITVAVLSVVTDTVLETTGIFPSFSAQQKDHSLLVWWMLLLALIYRSIYTVVGGYITAMLAPNNKSMRLAVILGIFGTIAATIGVIVGWDLSDHWYPIALAITAFPLIWLGAKLRIASTTGKEVKK